MRLDARDLDILRVLSSEGRITKAALAERVGLSPSPCWERLKKLEKAGVIESFRAEINLSKLGPSVTIFTRRGTDRSHRLQFSQIRGRSAALRRSGRLLGAWRWARLFPADRDARYRCLSTPDRRHAGCPHRPVALLYLHRHQAGKEAYRSAHIADYRSGGLNLCPEGKEQKIPLNIDAHLVPSFALDAGESATTRGGSHDQFNAHCPR